MVLGLLDDRYQFGSQPQYLAQFLSALIAVAFVIFIERINNPFSPSQSLWLSQLQAKTNLQSKKRSPWFRQA